MSFSPKITVFSPVIACLALILVLPSCTMPTKPEGADTEGMERIGDQLRKQGDDDGAANFYQRAIQHDPKDVQARIDLADILAAHGDKGGAEQLYAEGLALNPKNPELLRGHGRILLQMGDATAARDEYQKALRVDDEDVKALNGLGIALDMLGQHDAAQQAYREALKNDPHDLNTVSNLGHSYVLSGGYDAAIALLEPYWQDKDATPALRQNLAEAYGLQGMYADAERMGRMDLTAEQVRKNIAYYKAERAKLGLVPKYSADLGSYPTADMASGMANAIKAQFPSETDGLIIATSPMVGGIGSTPHFTLQATGFAGSSKLSGFCATLQAGGFTCKPHVN